MSWPGWIALAAAFGVLLLPSGVAARSGALAIAGRLQAPAGRTRFDAVARRLPWRAAVLVGAAIGLAVVGLRFGLALAVAGAALVGSGVLIVGDTLTRRAAAAAHRDLLAVVRVLVGELEAGAQSAAALAAAASAGGANAAAFDRAARAARAGGDVGAVLADDESAGVRVLGLAWRLGDATGAALAGVLERVAADLAAADEQRRTVAVALAGPRSSALLLSLLPLLGIGLGVAMGARPLALLFGAPGGRVLCCVGVLLDLAGVHWMRRILRRAEQA